MRQGAGGRFTLCFVNICEAKDEQPSRTSVYLPRAAPLPRFTGSLVFLSLYLGHSSCKRCSHLCSVTKIQWRQLTWLYPALDKTGTPKVLPRPGTPLPFLPLLPSLPSLPSLPQKSTMDRHKFASPLCATPPTSLVRSPVCGVSLIIRHPDGAAGRLTLDNSSAACPQVIPTRTIPSTANSGSLTIYPSNQITEDIS